MKKIYLMMGLLVLIAASIFFYARVHSKTDKSSLPVPENMEGREASAFLPPQAKKGVPAAKGSESLNLSGPVWVDASEEKGK